MFWLNCFRLRSANMREVTSWWTSFSSHCNLFKMFGTGKLQLFQPNQIGYILLNLQDCVGGGNQAIC